MHMKYTQGKKMENIISARIELSEYANKVLNMIKIKFNLHDKSEAINKFIDLYGEDVVEKEASDEYAAKIISLVNNHMKKYPNRRMTLQELDKLGSE